MLLHAQHKQAASPPATIKATTDKQKIVIGEPFHLMLEATVPDNTPFAWPGLDSLPHFDFLTKGKIDSAIHPGEHYYRQYLTITSFDSGMWAIPRLPFLAANKKVFSDSIRIAVGYTPIDRSKDFHDIKDIIDVPNPFAQWFVWIVAAFTLASLLLVFWLVRRKKLLRRLQAVKEKITLSPYEEAMQALDELERRNLPATGSMKLYYSRLGEILRVYLLRRMNVYSFAETSEELIRELRSRLPRHEELADALRMSDFVKFAKYQPGIADSEQHYRAVRTAIDAMEQALIPQPVKQTD